MKGVGEMKMTMTIEEIKEGIQDLKHIVDLTNIQIEILEGFIKTLNDKLEINFWEKNLKQKKLYVEALTGAIKNAEKYLKEKGE